MLTTKQKLEFWQSVREIFLRFHAPWVLIKKSDPGVYKTYKPSLPDIFLDYCCSLEKAVTALNKTVTGQQKIIADHELDLILGKHWLDCLDKKIVSEEELNTFKVNLKELQEKLDKIIPKESYVGVMNSVHALQIQIGINIHAIELFIEIQNKIIAEPGLKISDDESTEAVDTDLVSDQSIAEQVEKYLMDFLSEPHCKKIIPTQTARSLFSAYRGDDCITRGWVALHYRPSAAVACNTLFSIYALLTNNLNENDHKLCLELLMKPIISKIIMGQLDKKSIMNTTSTIEQLYSLPHNLGPKLG